MLVDTELDAKRCSPLSLESQRLTLWKFDPAIWLVLQVIDWQCFTRWLTVLDFRN